MSFNPFTEIANEMSRKMEKISTPPPLVCIINELGEIYYIDNALKDRESYIREFVNVNFTLIEEGQYSLPISGTLLGFFKMSPKLMFVLYMESGKMGNLLLYRGILGSYRNIIEELQADLQSLNELESSANLVLRLRQRIGFTGPVIPITETVEAGIPVTSSEIEIETEPIGAQGIYPELLERYRTKKFNFQEGIVLQYCKGQLIMEEIIAKSQFSEAEVKEIIDQYHKKGWLVLHEKGGATYSTSKSEESTESLEDISTSTQESQADMEGLAKALPETYPELLERFRTKKFNFKEGIILQYCKGQIMLKEIIDKCQFPEEEVLEIIDLYQKKGWLIIHSKS